MHEHHRFFSILFFFLSSFIPYKWLRGADLVTSEGMYLQGLGLCFQPSAFVPESGAKKTACRLMFPVFVTSMAPDPLDSPHGLGAYGSVPEPATPPPPTGCHMSTPRKPRGHGHCWVKVTAGQRSPSG